LGYES